MMVWAMHSPMPMPSCFVVKNGSNDRSNGSPGRAGPSEAHDLQAISRTPFGMFAIASIPLTTKFRMTVGAGRGPPVSGRPGMKLGRDDTDEPLRYRTELRLRGVIGASAW